MLKNALRDAARVYRTHWREGALAVLLQLLLRLMALAPLLFLCARETRFLALACLPLYVLLVLPVRLLTAQCMQSALSGGPLLQLPTMQAYGRALVQGLKRTGLMLLWAAPWLCATGFAVRVYSGNVDVFTLLRTLMSLGGGSSIQGVKIVLLIYAATLVPVLAGCAFHSGTRHAEALGGRSMLKGHRLGVMGCWLAGLIALLPFLLTAGWASLDYVSALVGAISSIGTGTVSLPPLDQKIFVIAAAFVVLLLPLLPLKQLLSAAYVRQLKEKQA